MIETIVPIAIAFFIVTVSPGPANIATAMVSMRYGRHAGIVFGAGLSCGLGFWGMIAATGMGAILQSSMHLLFALKIFGAVYLLWLAFQSGRAALTGNDKTPTLSIRKHWFSRGLLLNLSNPKAIFAWLAALSMGLTTGEGNNLLVPATMMCMALGFLNYTIHALAFSLPGFMAGYQRCQRWIDGVVATFFAMAGFGLIRSAFSR